MIRSHDSLILPDTGQEFGISLLVQGTIASVPAAPHDDLVAHLARTTPLSPGEAARVVAEVMGYFAEPVPEFVRRRHAS